MFLSMKGSTYDYTLPRRIVIAPFPLTELMLMIVGGSVLYVVMLMVMFLTLRKVVKVDVRETALREADEGLELHFISDLTRVSMVVCFCFFPFFFCLHIPQLLFSQPNIDAELPTYEGEREGPTQVSTEPTRNVQAKKNKTVEYI
ncbi:hypothetical protein BC829DRAFT_134981 [Chytridium lagenaria]|nr:hypothetical protein BC829DRAFT_134981 [Chytridium lagenaria]